MRSKSFKKYRTFKFYRQNYQLLAVLLVLIFATVIRFWGYDHRFLLGSDSARDALVAREMIGQHKLPLIGSFSSAGPFTFGPWWYWFVAATTLVWPTNVVTPWVFTTFSTIVAVYFLYLAGKYLGGFKTGLFTAILASVAPASLAFSANLTQHTMAGVFSAISIWGFLYALNKKSLKSFFILGASLGMAINMHYQALGLLPLFSIVFWVKPISVKKILLIGLGFGLTFIPLIIFDIGHNWLNIRGLIDFYTTRQYAFNAPNRWLTYVLDFWPIFWAKLIGGSKVYGFIWMGVSTLSIAWLIIKRQISRPVIAFLTCFALSFIMLRYFRGDRLDSYLLFMHPFIILTSAFALGVIARFNKWLAVLALGAILFVSWPQVMGEINIQSRSQVIEQMSQDIDKKFHGQKVTLYDGYLDGLHYSLPLALYLSVNGKIADNSTPVGLCTVRCSFSGPTFATYHYYEVPIRLDDLSGRPDITPFLDQSKEEKKWFLITPGSVYHSSIEWWLPYATSK